MKGPTMAKYDPLSAFLRRHRDQTVELSFREIENLIGAMLPKAANRPGWWQTAAADEGRGVQHSAWAGSGHGAALITGAERVRFTPRA